ncbi:hypothetical protein RhiirA1_449584 [Rhizophagus irregularis]|uniref:Uncharacterized protein n=1 Tax=Rhizophagus irregularis TaxID=588596 RepID=A0A2I1DS70_9GLOM|nr:hypothetical protein RhiirA1_449584 [Rhizophagus irregularis]PKY12695.1 hypothetical protein RhiirB3_424401 [Rhizophagus irregularis]
MIFETAFVTLSKLAEQPQLRFTTHQEQHQELKEKLDESDYKNLQEENEDLKQRILNQEKQKTNLLGETKGIISTNIN